MEASVYFRYDGGIEETPHGFTFFVVNCPALTAGGMLPNWTSKTQKIVTTKPCQDKMGQSFKYPTSQKSLLKTGGL